MATSLCTAFLFIRISVICINKTGEIMVAWYCWHMDLDCR